MYKKVSSFCHEFSIVQEISRFFKQIIFKIRNNWRFESGLKPPVCPSCKSTLVIQSDELLTSDDNVKDLDEIKSDNHRLNRDCDESQANLHHSASHSSIGKFRVIFQHETFLQNRKIQNRLIMNVELMQMSFEYLFLTSSE